MAVPRTTPLQQKFKDLVQTNEPLEIVQLYDSSGSISSDDFNRAKSAGIRLSWRFGAHVSIGVAQFAHAFENESDITNVREEVTTSIQGMRQLCSSTAMHLGLTGVRDMFRQRGQTNAEKVLIIFTDGAPDDRAAAIAQANVLKSDGINVICIGIGNVDAAYLRSVASPDGSFAIDSYRDLLNCLPPSATNRSQGIPNSNLDLEVTLVGEPIVFVGARNPPKVAFKITISNQGTVPVERNSTIHLSDKQAIPFFRPKIVPIPVEIAPFTEQEINVDLQICPGATIGNIPKYLHTTVKSSRGAEYITNAGEAILPIDVFVGDLFNLRLHAQLHTTTAANILCFGLTGAGKSTFINRVMSLMTNAMVRIAQVRQGNQSTTVTVDGYTLGTVPLKMWDTPGVSMDLYMTREFDQILAGQVPRDWSIDKTMTLPAITADQARAESKHSIIFVYPMNSLDDTNLVTKMREFIDTSIRVYRFHPVLLLTFADLVAPEEHQRRKELAHSLLGIVLADIYILDNSDKTDDKDTIVDRTVYDVLYKALTYAIQRIKTNGY